MSCELQVKKEASCKITCSSHESYSCPPVTILLHRPALNVLLHHSSPPTLLPLASQCPLASSKILLPRPLMSRRLRPHPKIPRLRPHLKSLSLRLHLKIRPAKNASVILFAVFSSSFAHVSIHEPPPAPRSPSLRKVFSEPRNIPQPHV